MRSTLIPGMQDDDVPSNYPLMKGWSALSKKPSKNNFVSDQAVNPLRNLTADQIVWTPFSRVQHTELPEHLHAQMFMRFAKTYLICFEKVFPHLPLHAARQLGLLQDHIRPLANLPQLKKNISEWAEGKGLG